MATNTAAAAKAAKAEAKQDQHVYLFKGTKFTFPADVKKVPIGAFEAGENGQNIGFVKGLMGDEQWTKYKDAGATLGDLEELSEWLGSSYGGFKNVGESSASDAS